MIISILEALFALAGVTLAGRAVWQRTRGRRVVVRPLSPAVHDEIVKATADQRCRYCSAPATGQVGKIGSGRGRILHCDKHVGHAVAEATSR